RAQPVGAWHALTSRHPAGRLDHGFAPPAILDSVLQFMQLGDGSSQFDTPSSRMGSTMVSQFNRLKTLRADHPVRLTGEFAGYLAVSVAALALDVGLLWVMTS